MSRASSPQRRAAARNRAEQSESVWQALKARVYVLAARTDVQVASAVMTTTGVLVAGYSIT